MASPLIEDFSDVAAFVQEDTSYVEQYAGEDELERKIAEAHAKYKEALARRQEEVRASRPWSAPPVESPRPEQQKEREKERQARGSNGDVDLDAPRAEYEPPVRPYLPQAQASGNNLSYLSRPQSAEHRTVAATRAALNARPSRVSLSGIEEETGEGTACDSRQASDMGRPGSTFGEGMSTSGGPADDVPGRDQDGAAAREDGEEGGSTRAPGGLLPTAEEDEEVGAGVEEEEDQEERQEVLKEEEDQEGGAAGEETDPRVVEPSAEEVAEDEENGDHGGGSGEVEEDHDGGGGGGGETSGDGDEAGDAAPVDEGVLMASGEALTSSLGVDGYDGRNVQHTLKPSGSSRDGDGGGDGEGERDGPEPEGSQERQGEDDDARSAAQGGAPSVAAASTPRSMAMRGFVEPLPYEASYGAGSAGRRSPAAAPPAPGAAEAEEDDEEADEEDYGEDTFETYEEQEDPEGDEERRSERGPSVSGEGSLLRASPSASKALLSTSLRSRAGSSVLAPPSKEPSKVAAATAPPPPPPLLPHASRSSTGAGADDDGEDGPAVPLSPAPPSASSLPPIRKTSSGTADGSGTVAAAAATAAVAASSDSLSARGPLAASHSQRSLSSSGAGAMPTPATSLPPPAPALLSELQPSQQFALQLLKHDIEVLPQHHRAAAEAAAARRRSATARPAGAGLAAFGYLGYHMVSEDLTAPSGPAFRSGSPGRGASPGRGGELAPGGSGSGALIGSTSLKAVRSGEAPVTARGDGRPTSAPHMRPSPEAIAEAEAVDVGVDGEDGAAAAAAAAAAAQGRSAGFVGMAREMRAGRLLPPVAQPGASRVVGQGNSGAAPAAAGVAAAEHSVSVIGESEANAAVAQSRMKFDVWLDALSNGGGGAAGGPAAHLSVSGADGDRDAAAAGGGGRRPPRPMTVPASGRRRPASARPGSGGAGAGHYMPQPAAVNIPKPLTRPMSAQPHHLRPGSATLARGGGGGGGGSGGGALGHFDLGAEPPVPMTVQPPDAAPAAGGTAAVEVGGFTVSVYVADTLKRIVEANRWLQQLGVSTKRYRLKDCLSNMTVQLVEELPPLPSDRAAGAGGAVAIVKELTLKQFLSGHAKLKQQARKLRQATALASAAAQQSAAAAGPGMGTIMGAGGSGMYGVPDYAGGGGGGGGRASNGRPFSATFGSGGFAVAAGPAVANGSRARPASAMPYSGVRTTGLSAGGADPSMYGAAGLVGPGGGGGSAVAYQGGRPVRPNSANPAYGRTPTFSNSYNLESSPPAAQNSPFAHTAYAAHAVAAAASTAPKSPGGGPSGAPRTAWGGGGGGGGPAGGGVSGYVPYPGGYPSTGGRGSSGGGAAIGGGPSQYFHRSISLTARTPGSVGFDGDHHHHGRLADDADSERAMVIEPDERGDVSRAVRQQLGSAADYCQTRRQEIARLRTLPLA